MHWDVGEMIWFKPGLMIDTIVYCALTFDPNLIGLDLDSSHRSARKQNFYAKYFNRFNGIWYTFEAWCDEPHAHFILSIQYSRENSTNVILLNKLWHWLVFRHLHTDFFRIWSDDRNT